MLLRPVLVLLSFVLICGCGGSGEVLYPVEGRVLKDGVPIQPATGFVVLKPEAGPNTEGSPEPAGAIEADGSFVVYTNDRPGAPPGRYRVVVTASGPTKKPSANQSHQRPMAQPLVPAKYSQPDATPLLIEVVADPADDAYDLKITNES
jgi:hypothetical protein